MWRLPCRYALPPEVMPWSTYMMPLSHEPFMPVTNLFTLKHECYPNIKVASPKFLHDMLISTQNHVALVKLVNPKDWKNGNERVARCGFSGEKEEAFFQDMQHVHHKIDRYCIRSNEIVCRAEGEETLLLELCLCRVFS